MAGNRSFVGFARRNILRIVSLGTIPIVIEYAAAVQRARASIHGDWALIIVIGLSAALAPIVFIISSLWWGLRHPEAPRVPRLAALALFLTLVMFLVGFAGMLYTVPSVIPNAGPPETVTTSFQLAAIAFMIPVFAALAAVLGLGPVLVARWRRMLR